MMCLRIYVLVIAFWVGFIGCRGKHFEEAVQSGPAVLRDLPEMKLDGQLILLTENTSGSYFLYKGKPMGFDYDLINRFAKDHGLRLKVKVVSDYNKRIELLNQGEGDIIACNLTIDEKRRGEIAYSPEINRTRMVLVQRKEQHGGEEEQVTPFLREPADLVGKTIHVPPFSTYHRQLIRMEAQLGIIIDIRYVGEEHDPEDLLRMVSEGEIDYTIADENRAVLNAAYYRNIDSSLPLSDELPIVAGFRANSDSLGVAFTGWLQTENIKRFVRYSEKKYFGSVNNQKVDALGEFSSVNGKGISAWDKVIKEQSKSLGWDWRLLAALIYHESRFNPDVRSFAGAFGLMQLMPETAARFGIDTTVTGEGNVAAGVKYLRFLDDFWKRRVESPDERLKFILASYNIGPGHVQDAVEIARSLGLNPKIWDNNVEKGMEFKAQPAYYQRPGVRHGYCRGGYVVEYVRKVLGLYEQFVQTI